MSNRKQKVGDLVLCWPYGNREISMSVKGIIVGFNKKGEGGQDHVHVLCNGKILTFMSWDIEALDESR
tara:strand:- start:24 stop:227 length:204 start_codon:yes stop_codon:yes gene_type:complete